MYEQYTDKQIVEMLKPKLTKIMDGMGGMLDTALEHSEAGRNLIKLIATIYRSAYIRGQLGRSFIIGEKKTKDPVNTFKVGDKVKFLGLNFDDEEALNNNPFYPPVNTVGKVAELGPDYCFVQWPDGATADNGVWACRNSYLEKVTEHWVPVTEDNVNVGSKVRIIDDKVHNKYPRWFPVVGTVGAIINTSNTSSYIQWPSGTTSKNDRRFCSLDWLEVLLCE